MDTNTSTTYYGSNLLYGCASGFEFADQSSGRSSFCDELGVWQPEIIECIGRLTYNKLLYTWSFLQVATPLYWRAVLVAYGLFAAVAVESFATSLDAVDADDASLYGLIAVGLLGSLGALIFFSDLAAILQALRFLKYNLHLSDVNPFASKPKKTEPVSAAPPKPYYYAVRSDTKERSHFSSLTSFLNRKKIYVSE